jgi:hypothetical protein
VDNGEGGVIEGPLEPLVGRVRGTHTGSPLEVASKLDDLCQEAADEIKRLHAGMQRIVSVLGPKAPPCCEGCEWEWTEALRVAREAIQRVVEE